MEEKLIQASGFVIQPRLQFQNIKDKMIYLYLLDRANYIHSSRCEIGQTIEVLTDLSKETGWSRDVIRGALQRLEKDNYINVTTLPQKRGMLITVTNYKDFQSLGTYKNTSKNPQENPHENPQEEPQGNPHEANSENPCESKVQDVSENGNTQENPQEEPQGNPHEIPHTITAFINSIININKTLKEYIVEAPVKNKNLSSTEEVETFVDFALRTNAFPQGISRKILISYFDCIRLTRQTCTISANILVNLIDKMGKYGVDQLHYAMWKHCEQHEDKREQYTLGILRNTDVHEAKRGLMKLKNKGVAKYAKSSGYPAAVGESTSSTSKEVERLEAIAREKGLHGTIRDIELDF